jgi:hypothetical protein
MTDEAQDLLSDAIYGKPASTDLSTARENSGFLG